MADYAKKTVAELQEILKTRGLPSSGKKAELIARLNENDKQTAEESQSGATEPESEPTPAPAAPVPAPAEPAPPTDPAPTADTTADHPSPDTALAAQTTYSLNLPTSTVDNELAKRKARAERFGTGAAASAPAADTSTPADAVPEPDAEALRNLERAKRFGTGQTAIGKLDEALPTESARTSRKRGLATVEDTEMDDPGLKRGFANRGRGGARARGRSRGGGGGGRTAGAGPGPGAAGAAKPTGVQKAPAYTSDKDRLAAEARKKKFATA